MISHGESLISERGLDETKIKVKKDRRTEEVRYILKDALLVSFFHMACLLLILHRCFAIPVSW